jgi:hypothetical protein
LNVLFVFKFKILGTKNKIQALIPNPTGSNLSTFHLCHWLKNKISKRLKSPVKRVLSLQLLVKTLSGFSTSDTKLSSNWHILNIDLFHIVLPLLMFDLGTLGFQLYKTLNKSIFCTQKQEIKRYEHFFCPFIEHESR